MSVQTADPSPAKREKYKVEWVPIDSIHESPENVDIYGPVADDEQMNHLVASVAKKGLEEPIRCFGR